MILAAFAILVATSIEPTLRTVGDACEAAMNRGQQHANRCSSEHAAIVEAELNRVWQAALPIIRAQDADWIENFDNPGYFDLVLEEQRAWVRYRQARCNHERFTFYGGSLAPYIYNSCMTDMALERIEILSGWAKQGTER